MKADVFLAFSFGERGEEPGLSNEAIAKDIKELYVCDPKRTFLVVQWEIGLALRRIGVSPDLEIGELGSYMNTIEVAEEMVGKLKALKFNLDDVEIMIFAHSSWLFSHRKRCVRVLRRLGVKSIVSTTRVPYDPMSNQRWTRNAFYWYIRSFLAISVIWYEELKIKGG